MDDDNRSEPGLSSAQWEELRLGARFVVRHRLPVGDSHPLSDAVGDVVELSPEHVGVSTRRHGVVRVARIDVVTVKEVPVSPPRRGRYA